MKLFTSLVGSALFLGTLNAATVISWVDGVSESGGWYDANKTDTAASDTSTDSNLCWAATASNMLNWWQHQYGTVPAGTPTGDAIWSTFKSSFSDKGSVALVGLSWWMTGKAYKGVATADIPSTWSSLKTGAATTGYYMGTNISKRSMTVDYEFVGTSLKSTPAPTGALYGYIWTRNSTGSTMATLCDALVAGLADHEVFGLALDSTVLSNLGHAITLWGFDYDDTTKTVTKLWVTDSDETKYQTGDVKLAGRIYAMNVTTDTSGNIMLTSDDTYAGLYYKEKYGVRLSSVTAMTANYTIEIPEPAGCALGLLGLASLLLRSRRKC